ncbi:MAG: gluconate 2-dehydrogenase subunit 3 family protein [Proteobacteria bacterium]|nr:gluconate 2-dehydrogenase subunit 3 family protein [Pseudomonadota bacterium]
MATNRREFLGGAGSLAAAALAAAHWPEIAAAHDHAARATGTPASVEFLRPAEARAVEALAALIVPSDDGPGAREAGALYFIDRSLRTWAAEHASEFRTGLASFVDGFAAAHGGLAFDAADAEVQADYVRTVESTAFFGGVRALTVIGLFALPAYGGNRGGAGWKLIGFDDQHAFSPPFGDYDRDYPGFALPEKP